VGVNRRLAPLFAKLLILVFVDMNDHGVAADASISHVLGLTSQSALGHLLDVLLGHLDLKGHTPRPTAFGEHAHGATLPRRVSSVVGKRGPVGRVVGVINHLSHRGGLQRG
jgi:hypothetical protein